MRILIISPNYPNLLERHAYGFVHSRAKIYTKFGNSVNVFIPSRQEKSYKYENIHVIGSSWKHFSRIIEEFDPDVICAHAPEGRWFRHISKVNRPLVCWIHGEEALIRAFHHYYCPFIWKSNIVKGLSLFIDPIKCLWLRQLLKNAVAVVYVSKWMKNIAEEYTQIKHPNSAVIPNPIDVDLFTLTNQNSLHGFVNGVSVRPLEWKYGLDIAIKAYSKLKGSQLMIVGKGLLETYMRKLANQCMSNVMIRTDGIAHNKLATFFSEFRYFVAPSRTEAQGVAMCEAMACGLPVIATSVGGIPEFVIDGFNGLLVSPENPLELRKAVKLLVSDHELHARLSKNAVNFVRENLSHNIIYEKETEVIKRAKEEF